MLGSRPYTVFAGRTHYFTHDLLDGRDYINMGMIGGIRHQMGPGAMDTRCWSRSVRADRFMPTLVSTV
ncbi:MAG TPA: hypothetical protein VKZ79_25010 [Alphaproteobacteria bacterium]|nr:hypothetical protein [Alphaproteobacteria bacterium]